LIRKVLVGTAFTAAGLILGLFLTLKFYKPPLSENYGKVDAKLFIGDGKEQPLIVAFGGSQGGNAWAENYWAEIRSRFLQQGYAVLTIGYFMTENTPEALDRISLNAIRDTIMAISDHPKIDQSKIALLGSSRGTELVLNLASRYKDFDAVVALVPSYVNFPSVTAVANTSAWTFNGDELNYVGIPFMAIGAALSGESLKAIEIALEDLDDSSDAIIPVQDISGPILLLSAKHDGLWPSKYMSDKIVSRLVQNNFKYYYEHFSFDGGHNDSRKHFDKVFDFLDNHFKQSELK
jgi:pimeloyl-ACP methyl ester carboxylesterase